MGTQLGELAAQPEELATQLGDGPIVPGDTDAPGGAGGVRRGGIGGLSAVTAEPASRPLRVSCVLPPSTAATSVQVRATASRTRFAIVTCPNAAGRVGSWIRLSRAYCAPTNIPNTARASVASRPTTHDRKPLRAPSNRASRPAT